ncbi:MULTISPECIES: glycosyltransferase [Bradyrhizobium]|uniref:glycosyltransferase n=1 Tax=Bradyrhizobium TaxID=374 RepID=UPI00115F9742|nr:MULTISPECIES: glycosyltransferase [Bradyrhizobium]
MTAQMCRCVAADELAIFCVLNRHLTPDLYPDLAAIPSKTVHKPNEQNPRNPKYFPLDLARAFASETIRRRTVIPSLVREAIAYGREQGVTSLWAILQGQTMVRIAGAVAEGLNVPLRAQVWDPLGWWLRAHGVDRFNRRADLAKFDETMRQATTCAAASWAMARQYKEQYGTTSYVIIASLDEALAHKPVPALRNSDEVVIGMAGQFYAEQEWHDLLQALNLAGWQIGGRKIVVRVAGHAPPRTETAQAASIEFLGWRSQPELIDILSTTCDIMYCPYPFSPQMEEVARLSFPSKIPTYLAAGRPILFHGPDYASPAHYLRERGAGLICRTGEPAAVYNAVLQLVEDTELYAELAVAAQAAFEADFALNSMKKSVRNFLGYSD